MLTSDELAEIERNHRATPEQLAMLLAEVRERRQRFVDAESACLDDALGRDGLDRLVRALREVMQAKLNPLSAVVGTPDLGKWQAAINEAALEAAHRIVNMEVKRPPCEHDELMYVCELERLRKRVAELEGGGDPPLARALNDALVRMDHMARSRSILSAGEVAMTLEWIRKTSLLLPGAS